MALALPELPYAKNALEPHVSANTLDFHHGKHHNAYVVNGNKLLEGTDLADKDVEYILKAAWEKKNQGLFNNAAQVWNHTFFWNSMKPGGGGAPSGAAGERIKADFGSVEKFAEEFKNAALTQFGSGWAWLVEDGGKLAVMKTPNAENPMVHGKKALLTVDVWEHAYYLDYQNRRPDFVQTFIDKLINWDFVNQNLK